MIEIAGKPKSKKFYLTTAIPYVNAAPHLGHALEFVQTDVIARYQKLQGKDVALVTGSDENSLKNVHAAEKEGITPTQLCARNAEIFRKMALKIGLSFTSFGRTSNKAEHWPGVHELWSLCGKAGDIYKKKYRGLYCVGCESFYEEGELPEGVCPEHKTKPEVVEEENFFFRLSKYQGKLEKLIASNEIRILPETRKNEVLSFIRGGLRDFSISRSVARAKGWGVPVPGDSEQIMYVWFDALGTYLTGIGYGTDEKQFKKYWPAEVHVIGKGILRFHAVYWPAILLSAGLKLPKTIFVHGYITVEGQKMSKSLGNIVDPFAVIEKYGVDPLRYCLLGEVPTFDDGDFSEKVLVEKNNSELVANAGNLVNRTVVFIANNFNGEVPGGKPNDGDKLFLEEQKKQQEKVTELLDSNRLKESLDAAMGFSRNVNKYFQDNAPWKAVKEDKERAATVLYVLANQVKDVAILLEPFLPNTSAGIFKQLNLEPKKWSDIGKLSVKPGHKLGTPEILFRKIEGKELAAAQQKPAPPTGPSAVFADLDLEVGEILEVKRHPDAEKLYVERVKMGDGERQVVSGLVQHLSEAELLGKKVIIVKNLAPAKLRGVESQGMLLVAEDAAGGIELLTDAHWKIGEKVNAESVQHKPKQCITFKEFAKIRFEIKGGQVLADGKHLSVGGKPVKTGKIKEGNVC
ncbi:methionine--tRNA ligase [Candidatus Micrarchaeota archaeon]|nr:methionine--tRNA ligase [Candidatus Micrarchaeota archaeon]